MSVLVDAEGWACFYGLLSIAAFMFGFLNQRTFIKSLKADIYMYTCKRFGVSILKLETTFFCAILPFGSKRR